MKVTVLTHTPEPEKTVAAAARLCYSNTSASELMENFTEEKASSFIKKLMEMGHMSPTEHVSFTFAIDGVSRTLLAQLTRHRIASYSVQSLRYNNPFKDDMSSREASGLNLPENLYYLEGLAYAGGNSPEKNKSNPDPLRKYGIRGKGPGDIPCHYFPAYLRGIYDGAGVATENPELAISFPDSLTPVFSGSQFNFTQKDGKLLLKNDGALNFVRFIYAHLDFVNSFYREEKLVEFCKMSREFFDMILKAAGDYIDSRYYATLPESIARKPEAVMKYIKGLEACKKNYIDLVKMGVDQEDARYILPMGTQTRLVMTMNVRSLYNFFNLRCCRRAQSEIRELANLMLAEVKKIAPGLFEKAGAPCEATGYCPEGKFSCGRFPAQPKIT